MLNQNEILQQCRLKNENAFEQLFNTLLPAILAICRRYLMKGIKIEIEEALQYGRIGIVSAVEYYRDDKGMAFYSFACYCIQREIYKNLINKKAIRTKKEVKFLSTDAPLTEVENKYLIDVLADQYYGDTEKKVLLKLVMEDIENKLGVDSMEFAILRMRLDGYSYKEIAFQYNILEKKVDYLLSKVRKKLAYLKNFEE